MEQETRKQCSNCKHGEEVSGDGESDLMVCDKGPEVVTKKTTCEEWEAKDGRSENNSLVQR